jgi:hypothetical protein
MSRRGKIWLAVAAVFSIVNAGGAAYALLNGEWMHGGIHVALLALTLYVVARSVPRRTPTLAEEPFEPARVGDERLEMLQQSVDAIAVEVERIGEAQRYSAKLQTEQNQGAGERG